MSKSRAPKRTLVLLQPADRDVFPGTARWLDAWPVDEHFHVRHGLSADVERVARILTGNAVCLVFGGGASRGYAHIGVLRAFEELGIPIDAVGGTSMGAAVAAGARSEEHTSELQSPDHLVCRLLLVKKKPEERRRDWLSLAWRRA